MLSPSHSAYIVLYKLNGPSLHSLEVSVSMRKTNALQEEMKL